MKRTCMAPLLLCLIAAVSVGCNSTGGAASAGSGTVYKAGTYSATERGFGGDITVTVVTDGKRITDVKAVGDQETSGVGGRAVEKLPSVILAAQSADVEGVSGATISSEALLAAASRALAEAKGAAESGTVRIKMAPGTYVGYGKGFSLNEKVPVAVTVSEDSIEKIEVNTDCGETPPILQSAIDRLVPRMLENQSTAVDAIVGATVSSNAIKQAVETALREALVAGGSSSEALRAFRVVPKKIGGSETIDVDVLVIGMGGSGTAAAMRTAESQKAAGRAVSVLAIDKAGKFGGTSSVTTQSWAVNPKKVQAEFNGGKDYVDVAALQDYWEKNMKKEGSKKTLFWDLYKRSSGTVLDWQVYEHGFYFGPPKTGFGNDGFKVVYNYGGTSGANKDVIDTYFQKIVGDYTAIGGKYMLETEGYDLIYDAKSNTVKGAKARNLVTGKEYLINAKAVIVATGGFGGSPELEKQLLTGNQKAEWKLFGMAQNDGKMWKAALKIGAGLYGMENCIGGNIHNTATPVPLDKFEVNRIEGKVDAWTGRTACWSINDIPNIMVSNMDTLFVGPDGRRYAREDLPWPWFQSGPVYYSIWSDDRIKEIQAHGFDHTHAGLFLLHGFGTFPLNMPMDRIYEVLDASMEIGNVVKADSLAALAKNLGMKPSVLEGTVERYNGYCEKGADGEFGKNPKYLKKIGGGPYYAVVGMPRTYSSDGGIDIDVNFNVLKSDGKTVIGGLYAVGTDCLAFIPSWFGGEAQAWSYISGYFAGQNAVEYSLTR